MAARHLHAAVPSMGEHNMPWFASGTDPRRSGTRMSGRDCQISARPAPDVCRNYEPITSAQTISRDVPRTPHVLMRRARPPHGALAATHVQTPGTARSSFACVVTAALQPARSVSFRYGLTSILATTVNMLESKRWLLVGSRIVPGTYLMSCASRFT